MSLYLRLLWTLLMARLRGPLPLDATVVQRWRVLPNDLDVNRHMNNGRYLTVVDLGLVEFFARTGFLRALLRRRWRPMAGGVLMHFRRGLDPFQRYELHFRWLCSDARWNYMAIEFRREGVLHAAGLMKGGAVARSGLVPTADYLDAFAPAQRALVTAMLARPLTPDVEAWRAAEQALVARIRRGEGEAANDATPGDGASPGPG